MSQMYVVMWVILRQGPTWIDGEEMNEQQARRLFASPFETIVDYFKRLNLYPMDHIDTIELVGYNGEVIDTKRG